MDENLLFSRTAPDFLKVHSARSNVPGSSVGCLILDCRQERLQVNLVSLTCKSEIDNRVRHSGTAQEGPRLKYRGTSLPASGSGVQGRGIYGKLMNNDIALHPI